MKVLLLVFIFGVTSAFADDSCSQIEIGKCGTGDYRHFIEDPDDLDSYCKSLRCVDDYFKRCPSSGFPESLYKLNQKVWLTMCFGSHTTIVRKYFENAKCLNRVTRNFPEQCVIDPPETDETTCELFTKFYRCIEQTVNEECGQDAWEVYEAFFPSFDVYGCNPPQ